MQQARVREFRESQRLTEDSDFAFHVSTYEEAKLAGGDFLAAAGAHVRAQEAEQLVPAAAAAMESTEHLRGLAFGLHPPRQMLQLPRDPQFGSGQLMINPSRS